MSSDEQDAAILRIVKERSENKRRRALLESEIRAASSSLKDLATLLGMIRPMLDDTQINQQLKNSEPWLSEKLIRILREYQETCAKCSQLDASAKEAGIFD